MKMAKKHLGRHWKSSNSNSRRHPHNKSDKAIIERNIQRL